MSRVLLQIRQQLTFHHLTFLFFQILTLIISSFPEINLSLLSTIFSHNTLLNLELASFSSSNFFNHFQRHSHVPRICMNHCQSFDLLIFVWLHLSNPSTTTTAYYFFTNKQNYYYYLFHQLNLFTFYVFTFNIAFFPLFILIAALLSYLLFLSVARRPRKVSS